MAVIGIGAMSRTSVEEVLSVIQAARLKLDATARSGARDERTLSVLAALDRPGTSAVLARAAEQAGLRFLPLPLPALAAYATACVTHSAISIATFGIPSVAEAAALAGAGAGARLILPRFCGRNTTASVAGAP